MRIGIEAQLARSLCSTNPCGSMIEIVRYTQRNVKRWQDGDMRKRWTAAGMLVAEQQFRRIIGYRDLAKLVIAIDRDTLAAEKNHERQEIMQPITVRVSTCEDRHRSSSWAEKYSDETQVLLDQITQFMQLRTFDEIDDGIALELMKRHGLPNLVPRGVALILDQYSVACQPRAQMGQEIAAGGDPEEDQRFELIVGDGGDALDLPADEYDVIIGDPPYGFNTTNDVRELARLYRRFARVALLALRDGGDLMLCLPERSHSGRYSPAFTHRALVLQQLFVAAGEVERQLLVPHDRVGGADGVFESDYYWESHRALRRSILHVQVRRLTAAQRAEASGDAAVAGK
jgi:hypothetical protein